MSVNGKYKNRVLYLEIDNIENGNSFGLKEAKDLRVLLKSIRSETLAVVLQAKGSRWFCSGGNLSYYARQKSRAEGLKDNRTIEKAIRDLRALKVPVIALVRGDCFGGGMELLAACDIRWSTPDSCFGFWQRRIGLTFGWGGYSLWRESVGERTLRKECFEARSLSSYEARDMGLIDRVIPRDAILGELDNWLTSFEEKSLSPVPLIKGMDRKNSGRMFQRLWWGVDHRLALKRFARSIAKLKG